MKTIELKGRQYAPVSARVEQLHKDHKECSITTDTTFSEGHVIVKATLSFDRVTMADGQGEPYVGARTFTGHAYGKVGAEKAFEKLETTAVGRALAFAGYLAGGEIASYDEVKEFHEEVAMTVEDACHKLKVVTTIDNLKAVWTGLPKAMRDDSEVLEMKEKMKSKLTE